MMTKTIQCAGTAATVPAPAAGYLFIYVCVFEDDILFEILISGGCKLPYQDDDEKLTPMVKEWEFWDEPTQSAPLSGHSENYDLHIPNRTLFRRRSLYSLSKQTYISNIHFLYIFAGLHNA